MHILSRFDVTYHSDEHHPVVHVWVGGGGVGGEGGGGVGGEERGDRLEVSSMFKPIM